MLAISDSVFQQKVEEYLTRVREQVETLFVTGKEKETVVILSQERYKEMQRRIHNLEYEIKLLCSELQIQQGKVVTKTLEELQELE